METKITVEVRPKKREDKDAISSIEESECTPSCARRYGQGSSLRQSERIEKRGILQKWSGENVENEIEASSASDQAQRNHVSAVGSFKVILFLKMWPYIFLCVLVEIFQKKKKGGRGGR